MSISLALIIVGALLIIADVIIDLLTKAKYKKYIFPLFIAGVLLWFIGVIIFIFNFFRK